MFCLQQPKVRSGLTTNYSHSQPDAFFIKVIFLKGATVPPCSCMWPSHPSSLDFKRSESESQLCTGFEPFSLRFFGPAWTNENMSLTTYFSLRTFCGD